MNIIEQHQEALLIASRIGDRIQAMGREQFKLEREAYIEVFGEMAIRTASGGSTYMIPHWFKVNDTSQIEAWHRGTYGGQDEPSWTRTLDLRMEDPTQHSAVKAHYVAEPKSLLTMQPRLPQWSKSC